MSKVFSFRLNKANPREAKALNILQTKNLEGISLRLLITDSLLSFENHQIEVDTTERNSIRSMFTQILDQLKKGENTNGKMMEANETSKIELTDQFKNSLKREVKIGLKT